MLFRFVVQICQQPSDLSGGPEQQRALHNMHNYPEDGRFPFAEGLRFLNHAGHFGCSDRIGPRFLHWNMVQIEASGDPLKSSGRREMDQSTHGLETSLFKYQMLSFALHSFCFVSGST